MNEEQARQLYFTFLRSRFNQSVLTDEQTEHIEGILKDFCEEAYEKYVAGQKEHGGDLWKKDIVLPELKKEFIDGYIYSKTLERQVVDAGVTLGEHLPD